MLLAKKMLMGGAPSFDITVGSESITVGILNVNNGYYGYSELDDFGSTSGNSLNALIMIDGIGQPVGNIYSFPAASLDILSWTFDGNAEAVAVGNFLIENYTEISAGGFQLPTSGLSISGSNPSVLLANGPPANWGSSDVGNTYAVVLS